MRICVFGTFDSSRHPRVQVLEEGLRARGCEVVRCNEPWFASTEERVQALRRPWIAARLLARLARAWAVLYRRSRRVGAVDVVLTGYLGVFDIHLARLLFRRSVHVLDHMAPVTGTMRDRGAVMGPHGRIASLLDRAATAAADVVLVDTPEHANDGDLVVPVGAPTAWFRDRPLDRSRTMGPLKVVFFGLYTPLQGTPTIARAMRTLFEEGVPVEITLVGMGQEREHTEALLRGLEDVRWVDWVDADVLPAFVAQHDVCLGIFGTTPKAHRVVPNKVYQGAACGCVVVTSDTPPQRRLLAGAAVLVPAGDSAALAAALRELAFDTELRTGLRSAAFALAAAQFRPEQIVVPLLERLGHERPELGC